MSRFIDHLYILSTIIFTVYSQLIMRWQVQAAGSLPVDMLGRISFVVHLLLNPWVISAVLATFFAGISWMLAMTKFEISYAFPFVSLNYVFIIAGGIFVFNESVTVSKLVGSFLAILSVVLIARG